MEHFSLIWLSFRTSSRFLFLNILFYLGKFVLSTVKNVYPKVDRHDPFFAGRKDSFDRIRIIMDTVFLPSVLRSQTTVVMQYSSISFVVTPCKTLTTTSISQDKSDSIE